MRLRSYPATFGGVWRRQIASLGDSPRQRGSLKLADGSGQLRIRVGDYRIQYQIDDEGSTVTIVSVRHRSNAYR
ncbi:MAG: type II toxin-antitoxin system RelE/ParE family toxin [Fimbriimonadales bacterium]